MILRTLAAALVMAAATPAKAACTAKDFATAVDQSAASLRTLTNEFQPKLKESLRRYQEAKGLPQAEADDAALDVIQDPKLATYDDKISDLILKIDTLGRVKDDAGADCAKLEEVKAASKELLVVMRSKSDFMLAELDAMVRDAEGKRAADTAKPAPPPPEPAKRPDVAAKAPAPAPPEAEKRSEPKTAARPRPENWSATTTPSDAYKAAPPNSDGGGFMSPSEDGYTIDEIREATRGFFGTVSTSLASVIEHAFKLSGRPTAYVLGTEGGGAFLAGLRYGEGTLYMRNVPEKRKVYWHGPSLGYDVGADGGRTLFLIYRLPAPDDLFRGYTGINGSAYLVGGVGITFLKGGDVIMAPIRSGIGLRLGANIGYLSFTDTPTWNPF